MAMSPRYSPAFTLGAPGPSCTGFRLINIGKESTSVGPFFLRNVSFNRAISASLTKQTVTPALGIPNSSCTRRRNDSSGRRARRTARWRLLTVSRSPREIFIPVEFLFLALCRISRRRSPFAIRGVPTALRLSTIILFIGADNLLHQVVPHNVLLSKLHHGDPVNLAANFQRFDQAGLLSLRQVDLRNVAGNHRLGVEP